MKIIGSRSGGYEFFVKLFSGYEHWMGEKENSDFDISLEPEEEIKDIPPNADIWREPPLGPYYENGKLHMPSTFDYLAYPLSIKMMRRSMIIEMIFNEDKVALVLDKDKNTVGSFVFKIPYRVRKIFDNWANDLKPHIEEMFFILKKQKPQ